jgi:polysaccharide pyruvyl transferase WcaK-like protein
MNIYVKAYLDKNYGDDLMLVRLAGSVDPSCVLYINCEKPMEDYYHNLLKEFSNYKFIQCPLRNIHRYGKNFFACILLIGGSVLQGNNFKGCFYRFLNTCEIGFMRAHGTPYAIVDCNTGPFINRITELFVRGELRQAALVTTRDSASLKFIKNSIGKKTRVYQYPDMLMTAAQILCGGHKENDG